MRLNIKNMVCNNCVNALRAELTRLGIHASEVGLGFAEFDQDLAPEQITLVRDMLPRLGFQLIEDQNRAIVEAVKHEILRHINSPEPCHTNLSHCIAHATGLDYKYVSRLFSATEGRTIEKYYIMAKIEKAKELLSYGDIPIAEIAYRLGYSSVAFLSRQFKQITGKTLSQYQNAPEPRRPFTEL